tara:strand:+ start:2665 stop:3411 length:747 start_codon:yes stop_codon:yes gene_type:complete
MKRYIFVTLLLFMLGIGIIANTDSANETVIPEQDTEQSAEGVLSAEELALQEKKRQENLQQEKQEEYNAAFNKEMLDLQDALRDKQHSVSIEIINKIMNKVKLQQEEQLQSFFPKVFSGYRRKLNQQSDDHGFSDSNYGVLFTQQYNNPQGHTLEVNVIYSDESIQDFSELIKNPKLVRGMENTKIVKNNNYKAIETISEDQTHYEQNIILSESLMMTLVSVGQETSGVLNEFISLVNVDKLQQYLAN